MSEYQHTASPSFGVNFSSLHTHLLNPVSKALEILGSSIEATRICESAVNTTGTISPKQLEEIRRIIGIAPNAN